MTGLVGVIANDRRFPVSQEEVDALGACYELARGAGDRTYAIADTYARFIKIDTVSAVRPGIEEHDGSWAISTGVVHGAQSLIGAELRLLDGQFALARYDRRAETVTVAEDPFGLHAFYTAERAGKTYFSTSALALARHLQARPNYLALSMLLCCGTQHGALTNWEGIARLGPGASFMFGPGGCRQDRYWQLEVDGETARLDFRGAVDHAIEVLTEALRRTLGACGPMWCDLTGGYDTRLLALLLRRAGVGFHANTVGPPTSRDVRLGRRVAHAGGWQWTHFRAPEAWAELAQSYLPAALAWADGRLPVLPLTHVLWTQEQKHRHHLFSLAGGGGEVFRGHSWRQELFGIGRTTRVDFDRLIRTTLLDHDAIALQSGTAARDVVEYLRTIMIAQTKPYAGAANTTQLDVLLAYRKPIWDGMYGSAAGAYVQIDLPFLYRDVFTVGFSTYFRHRRYRRLVRAMIERLDPYIAAIPTAMGGPAVPLSLSTIHRYVPYYAYLGRLFAAKAGQKVLGRGISISSGDDDPRIDASRRAIEQYLELRPSNMLSASLYKPDGLAQLLSGATTSTFGLWSLWSKVMTVELILRSTERG